MRSIQHVSLFIPDVMWINRGVAKKDDIQGVEVTLDDEEVTIALPGNAIEVILTLEELRAIMRLFDVTTEKP